jgi:hypothetical protein
MFVLKFAEVVSVAFFLGSAQPTFPVVIVINCATVALDNISSTMTYLMCHEQHLWNDTLLLRVIS